MRSKLPDSVVFLDHDEHLYYTGIGKRKMGTRIRSADDADCADFNYGSSRESVGINEGLPRSKDGFSQA
jgi:hypothetical protein